MIWAPTTTPTDVIMHSQGTWDKHKYIKVVDGKYYYPNSYEDGRTISDLKDDDVDKIAKETMQGKHGNGDERKAKFGGDYNKIQNRVNELSGSKKRHKDEDEDKSKEEEKKSEEEEKDEDKDKEEKSEDKDKKKGKGSSKKKSNGKKKSSSKKSSGSKSGSKSSGSSGKSQSSAAHKLYEEIMKKREQERKAKEKERRRKRNIINRKEYLNHSGIWAPTSEFRT